MASHLLRTKLMPPTPRTALVVRTALTAQLDEGLTRKLTLLSAPAGYGKTTLVAQWLATNKQRPKAAWVALDPQDNDPYRFWQYLVGACQQYAAGIGDQALALLRHEPLAPIDQFLTPFINDLAALHSRAVLVLEDYHLITTPQIHEGVNFLLNHLPPTLHLLIITRSDPPLSLVRQRAAGELLELRASDMRFSVEETLAFLHQTLPFALDTSEVEHLQCRTEGWPAALRLLTLILATRHAPHERAALIASFAGDHRHVLPYLVADVLDAQPEPLQDFLLLTSGLPRLNASLCDAVTGHSDSAAVLAGLERANLFLTAVDDARHWYRYHALFAEAMQYEARERLGEARMQHMWQRAIDWYEAHGLRPEATEAALAARDWERTCDLIEQTVGASGISEQIHTLRRWLEQIPQEQLQTRPALCFTYALTILFTEDRRAPATLARIEAPLEVAERLWRAADNQPRLVQAVALRSMVAWWQGDRAQSFAAAHRALASLPDTELAWRSSCLIQIAIEALFLGDLRTAQERATEARDLSSLWGNRYAARAAMTILAEIFIQQGALHQADRLLARIQEEAHNDPVDRGHALVVRAALAYEWNDLASAQRAVDAAIALANQYADTVGRCYTEDAILGPATIVQARIAHASGETERGQELLHIFAAQSNLPAHDLLHRELRAEQARLALAVGNFDAVQSWATSISQRDDDIPITLQQQEALIVARLLVAQGDATAALRALDYWLAQARAAGRIRSELEIMACMAHALAATDAEAAQQLIQSIVRRAQPEGYQRLLLDEGPSLRPLLQSMYKETTGIVRSYIEALLDAFRTVEQPGEIQQGGSFADPTQFVEPLTPHEGRVLRLLSAGLSNPEIAEELIVSVNTVKTHVQSIFRKLDVSNRKQATALARKLNLV